MKKAWKVRLIGDTSLYYRVDPNKPVAEEGEAGEIKADAKADDPNAEMLLRLEDDDTFSLIAVAATAKYGRDVFLSSPDTRGVIRTRFERNADETFHCLQSPDGVLPKVVAFSPHRKDGKDFAPTLFTVEVKEAA